MLWDAHEAGFRLEPGQKVGLLGGSRRRAGVSCKAWGSARGKGTELIQINECSMPTGAAFAVGSILPDAKGLICLRDIDAETTASA